MNRWLALGCYVGILVMPLPGRAHSFLPAALVAREVTRGVFDVVWKAPAWELGVSERDAPIIPELPSECQRLDTAADDGGGAHYWRADCGSTRLHGTSVSVHGLAGSRVEVIVQITWQDGETFSGVLRDGTDTLRVPLAGSFAGAPASTTTRAILASYSRRGIGTMLGGLDHLLFLLALMLLVDSWSMLFAALTAFTLAHSAALPLAVLGVIQVPQAPVEASIALSIVIVAVELTRAAGVSPGLSRRSPWLVAGAFGFFHGLSFAGALMRIGVPSDQGPLALLAFNVGVEIGQLLFVVAMLAPLAIIRGMGQRWPQTQLLPAYAIGAVAMAWVIERVWGFWQA